MKKETKKQVTKEIIGTIKATAPSGLTFWNGPERAFPDSDGVVKCRSVRVDGAFVSEDKDKKGNHKYTGYACAFMDARVFRGALEAWGLQDSDGLVSIEIPALVSYGEASNRASKDGHEYIKFRTEMIDESRMKFGKAKAKGAESTTSKARATFCARKYEGRPAIPEVVYNQKSSGAKTEKRRSITRRDDD